VHFGNPSVKTAVASVPIIFGSGLAIYRRPGDIRKCVRSLFELSVVSQGIVVDPMCHSGWYYIVLPFCLSVRLSLGIDVTADLRVHVAILSSCPTLVVIAFVRVAVFRQPRQTRRCYSNRKARCRHDAELLWCLASHKTSICVAPYCPSSFDLGRCGRCCPSSLSPRGDIMRIYYYTTR
jgi:hypothetical protein